MYERGRSRTQSDSVFELDLKLRRAGLFPLEIIVILQGEALVPSIPIDVCSV